MKVRVKKAFWDTKKKVSRKVNEVFDATQARIDEIKGVDPELIEIEKSQGKAESAQADREAEETEQADREDEETAEDKE